MAYLPSSHTSQVELYKTEYAGKDMTNDQHE